MVLLNPVRFSQFAIGLVSFGLRLNALLQILMAKVELHQLEVAPRNFHFIFINVASIQQTQFIKLDCLLKLSCLAVNLGNLTADLVRFVTGVVRVYFQQIL